MVSSKHHLDKVWRDDAGRFVQVEVGIGEQVLCFVSLYAPNINLSRNKFFALLPDLMDMCRPTFFCGDFKPVLDPNLDRRHPRSFQRPAPNCSAESVTALQSLLSATQTFPTWRSLHPGVRTYSWDHASGDCSSQIDMIWAPIGLKDQIKDCNYYPSFFTDHRYIQVTFSLNTTSKARGPGYWKFNTSLLEDQEYCDLVKSFWSF